MMINILIGSEVPFVKNYEPPPPEPEPTEAPPTEGENYLQKSFNLQEKAQQNIE